MSQPNDSESDEDSFYSAKQQPSDSDSSEEVERDGATNDVRYDIPTKLALVNRLKEINTHKISSHKAVLNKLDWSKVKIKKHSKEELKDCLKQILSKVCTVRTLDEMLNDYLDNYQKYELKKSLNAPKMPIKPCWRYISEHREELQKKLEKKHPNKTIKFGQVYKYGTEKFSKLPEKEKEPYMQRHKEERYLYRQHRAELIKNNPELRKKRP